MYRPPCSSLSNFISDFDEFLELLCLSSNLLILGDFNLHMNDPTNYYVKRFSEILQQYGLCQYVCDSTHVAGHTIDLIIARAFDRLIDSVSVHDYGISDHSLVLCNVNFHHDENPATFRNVRNRKIFNFE